MKGFIILALTIQTIAFAQKYPLVLDERSRAEVINTILDDRFNNLLPQLMRREGFDMWILISREYHEDPVMKTMLPAEWLSARRRTVFVFYDNGKTVEKLAIARYDVGPVSYTHLDVYKRQIQQRIEDRVQARQAKKFQKADEIRQELEKSGIILEDKATGTVWRRV